MSLADAFAVVDAHNRALVAAQTWGHLAPKPREPYHGSMLLAHPAYGDLGVVLIDAEFPGLPDSPWLYDDMVEYLDGERLPPTVEGGIYRWEGIYMKYKNGGCRFSGRLRLLSTPATVAKGAKHAD